MEKLVYIKHHTIIFLSKNTHMKNKVFVTADLHFYDTHMLERYENNGIKRRDYCDVFEMNNAIINKWNRKVSKKDTVFILGDIAKTVDRFDSFLNKVIMLINRLNGNKIVVTGNHESTKFIQRLERMKIDCYPRLELTVDVNSVKRDVELIHDPKMSRNSVDKVDYVLHGHLHGDSPGRKLDVSTTKFIDCGWDVLKEPVELTKLLERYE